MLDRSLSRSTREGEHRGRIARSLRTGAVGRPSSSSVSMGARLAEAEDARRLGSMRHRRERRGGRAGHLGSERPCGRWRGLEVGGLDPDLFAAHEAHSPPGSIVVKGREDAVLPVLGIKQQGYGRWRKCRVANGFVGVLGKDASNEIRNFIPYHRRYHLSDFWSGFGADAGARDQVFS